MRTPSQIMTIIRVALQDPKYINYLPQQYHERYLRMVREGNPLPAPYTLFESVLEMLSVAISDDLVRRSQDQETSTLSPALQDLRDAP